MRLRHVPNALALRSSRAFSLRLDVRPPPHPLTLISTPRPFSSSQHLMRGGEFTQPIPCISLIGVAVRLHRSHSDAHVTDEDLSNWPEARGRCRRCLLPRASHTLYGSTRSLPQSTCSFKILTFLSCQRRTESPVQQLRCFLFPF